MRYDRPDPGLYLHIAYCASLCSYCDFFRVASPFGVPDPYVDLLLEEAGYYREEPPIRLDSLYFGGGTPSLMTPSQIRRLIRGLSDRFAVPGTAEITLEANPETVTPQALEAWRDAGINRLSLGIQSLSPALLRPLDRRAGAERSREALRAAARAGFGALSADLIAGLPGQRTADLLESAIETLDAPVDHVSCYLLALHPGSPLERRVTRGECRLPSEDATADMLLALHECLSKRGFEHYEISNFARPGFRSRHNLKYWLGHDAIGIGPSAHGRFRGWMTANPASVEDWSERVRGGGTPCEIRVPVTPEMEAEDRVIFGLRLSGGLDPEEPGALERVLGPGLSDRMRRLTETGHAEWDDRGFRLTLEGFLVSTEVLGFLLPDSYAAEPAGPPHSR